MSIVSCFMPTIANEDVVQTVGVKQIAVAGHGEGSRSVEAVTTASVENDVHLTAFPRSFPAKSRSKEDLFQLSREERDLLENRHKLYCINCRVNVFMRSRQVYEIK